MQSPPGAMKIFNWNCQGVGSPWTVCKLKEIIRLHRPGLVFISETKCKAKRCDRKEDVKLPSYATVKSDDCATRWRFTSFYGYLELSKRKEGWELLRRHSRAYVRPWLCAVDFNEVLEQHEKQGSLPRAEWQIKDFSDCLADCDFKTSDSRVTRSPSVIIAKARTR
ncbi:UNVERIFIED_CONTAM: hypothetical protein Slati_2734800 [Sesamum latifolium]|uniref:Endonuclease/exonuclease/phosphatase domain-containing protein n=1 Tax=Sesamum latifolium TaxID=2727402 RepID=A0AAW2VWX0_9LAMI